ncbi:hypothetical protein ACN47E_004289 [Coniothyrium glycines]
MVPARGPRAFSSTTRAFSSTTRAFFSTACALIAATLLVPCLAQYTQQNTSDTPGFRLLPGVASVPVPVSVAPDQNWSGIDGAWNTFSLMVGDPQANVRVFVSTASQQIWVVNRQACISNITDSSGQITQYNAFSSDCEASRGYLYNTSTSESWHEKGFFRLWLEQNLGLVGNGLYGFDSVGLGMLGEQGPTVANTTIGTLVSANFWLGHIGVHPKPTNFSAFESPIPSYMTSLFDQKSIPSLSFGYTAGARYRDQTVLGSLTLGGYDASRIIRNDLTFIFAPDNERDLVVGMVGLTANTTTSSNIDLLRRSDATLFIDSTVAELWLPVEICKAFEDAFGLRHDSATDLYLVDDALHEKLLILNPSVTFTLGQKYSTDATMQITLPYDAFDLEASPPYRGLNQSTRYFPIRRGNDSSQWILGRTFLQEAYLTVDWERQNFSVSAIDWTFGKPAAIMPIVSPQYAEQHFNRPKKPLSTGAIIGAAVGGGFAGALILCLIGWWFWRRRHHRKLEAIKAKYEAKAAAEEAAKKETSDEPPVSPVGEDSTNVIPKAELSGDSAVHHELSTEAKVKASLTVSEAAAAEIYEMPGDMPQLQEAGGRQLSEKETMVVREKIYNGTDPNGIPEVFPAVQEPSRRLAPISLSQVSLMSGHLPSPGTSNISPITPRTPRDGAFLEASDTFFQLPPYRAREGRSAEEDFLSPISPLEGSTDTSRRRFSYES